MSIEVIAGAIVSALTEILGTITIGGENLPTWAKYLCVIILGSVATAILTNGNISNESFTNALIAVVTAAFGTHATFKTITKTIKVE